LRSRQEPGPFLVVSDGGLRRQALFKLGCRSRACEPMTSRCSVFKDQAPEDAIDKRTAGTPRMQSAEARYDSRATTTGGRRRSEAEHSSLRARRHAPGARLLPPRTTSARCRLPRRRTSRRPSRKRSAAGAAAASSTRSSFA